MPINENMVQEIVQEVMAKMQIADAPTGKHGIFKEMNDAIEAAKKSQLIVKKMSMDQREKIITSKIPTASAISFLLYCQAYYLLLLFTPFTAILFAGYYR